MQKYIDKFIPENQRPYFMAICDYRSNGFTLTSEEFTGEPDYLVRKYKIDGLTIHKATIYNSDPFAIADKIHAKKNKYQGKTASYVYRRSGYLRYLVGIYQFCYFHLWLVKNKLISNDIFVAQLAEMVRTNQKYTILADIFCWNNDETIQKLVKLRDKTALCLHIQGFNPCAPKTLLSSKLTNIIAKYHG